MTKSFEQELEESLQIRITDPMAYLEEVRKTGDDRLDALCRPTFKPKQYRLTIASRWGMARSISTNMPTILASAITGVPASHMTAGRIMPSYASKVRLAMRSLGLDAQMSGRPWDRSTIEKWVIEDRTPLMPTRSKLSVMYRARVKIKSMEAVCQG